MFTRRTMFTAAATLMVAGSVAIISACSSDGGSTAPQTDITPGMMAPQDTLDLENAGARIWAENCIRCHNIRPPAGYSDRQWMIVMRHMRQRGNLTGQQQESVLRFLQSAN